MSVSPESRPDILKSTIEMIKRRLGKGGLNPDTVAEYIGFLHQNHVTPPAPNIQAPPDEPPQPSPDTPTQTPLL